MMAPDEYRYYDAARSHTHSYLGVDVLKLIMAEQRGRAVRRIFELGCGNGSFAAALFARDFEVTAVDLSTSGIDEASQAFAGPTFAVASAYDDLASIYGQFDLVVSLEVVEHLYSPRKWATNLRDLLVPGGLAIVSAPYHGYLKNLALAVVGGFDSHMNPLWDHGHIKFWSVPSLTALLLDAGLQVEMTRRVGRIPPLAKSMILAARKPPPGPTGVH